MSQGSPEFLVQSNALCSPFWSNETGQKKSNTKLVRTSVKIKWHFVFFESTVFQADLHLVPFYDQT